MPNSHLVEETQMQPPGFRPEVFRKKRFFAFVLAAIFTFIYFGAALLTSAPLKTVAALEILGLPLGIWVGWLVFVSGLAIVHIYLTRGGK